VVWSSATLISGGLASCRSGCSGNMAADLGPGLRVVALQWNDDFCVIHESLHLPASRISA